jgi:hypothetical protein
MIKFVFLEIPSLFYYILYIEREITLHDPTFLFWKEASF